MGKKSLRGREEQKIPALFTGGEISQTGPKRGRDSSSIPVIKGSPRRENGKRKSKGGG